MDTVSIKITVEKNSEAFTTIMKLGSQDGVLYFETRLNGLKELHAIQARILEVAEEVGFEKLDAMPLRGVGELVGVYHAQQVKFHIQALKDKGLWGKKKS